MSAWKIEKRDSIFKSGVFGLEGLKCRHPGKSGTHTFYVLNSPDWINVVALDENGRFIFVRQHRLGTDGHTLETPAGLIEEGEDPAVAARRELLEETGYSAGDISLMKKLSANPAILSNHIYFFRATGCRKTSSQNLDRAEDIEVKLYTEEEIKKMMEEGTIDHSIIYTALCLHFMGE